MLGMNRSENKTDSSSPDDPVPLHVLALCSRKEEDFHCLQGYVRARCGNAQVTYLLPDIFAEDLKKDPWVRQVFPYAEEGRTSGLEKLRVLVHLRRNVYSCCVFPLNTSDTPRYHRLFIFIFFLRMESLLIMDPSGKAEPWSKTKLMKHFARSCYQQAYEKWEPRARVLYYTLRNTWVNLGYTLWLLLSKGINKMEAKMDEHFDMPVFFLLIFVAKFRVFFFKNVTRRLPRRLPSTPRVAHFISSLDMGGVQRQLLTFLEKTDSILPHTSVFVYDPLANRFEKRFEAMGIPFERIKLMAEEPGTGGAVRFLWTHFPTVASAFRLRSFLKEQGGTSVLHNWEFRANTVGSVAAALAGTPVILSSVRNMSYWKKSWDRRWWHRWADRLTAGLNDRIVVNAAAVKSDYSKWALISGKQIITIHNGLDPETVPPKNPALQAERKQELGWTPSIPVIGWVGRFAPQKDPETFLRFAKDLLVKRGETGFVMLGDGELLQDTKTLCGRLKLDGNVRFLGARLDVYRWMQAMDVLVMTSIIEGMPNVLIEAQFMGISCVTTDAGGAAEVVEDGRSGFVVPIGNVRGLVDRCGQLLEDAFLRDRFVVAGRERAEKAFNANRMAHDTILLYHRLLEENRSRIPSCRNC